MPTRKLTDDQIIEMRRRFAQGGITAAALGREYGVSRAVASMVLRGITYGNLPGAVAMCLTARRHLTPDQVAEARRKYQTDPTITYRELAAQYGVTVSGIYGAITGRTYKENGHPPAAAHIKNRGPRQARGGKAVTGATRATNRRNDRKARAIRLANGLAAAVGQPYVVIERDQGYEVIPKVDHHGKPTDVVIHDASPN